MLNIIRMRLLSTRTLESKYVNIFEICNTSGLVQASYDRYFKRSVPFSWATSVMLGKSFNFAGCDEEVSLGNC